MERKYNLRNPGIKRLMREAIELAEPTEEYCANPLEDNLFEWHFTVRGPPNTEFEEGIYHGRIILPTEYPMKPPDIILLTPNGRFETNKKICLSISGHHPESWQPSWSIRTALLALIAFMPTKTIGAIGSLDYSPEERKLLARKSRNWECEICGKISEKLAHEHLLKPLSTTENVLLKQITELNEKQKENDANNDAKVIQKIFEHNNIIDDESVDNLNLENIPVVQEAADTVNRSQIIPTMAFVLTLGILVLIARRCMMLSISGTNEHFDDDNFII